MFLLEKGLEKNPFLERGLLHKESKKDNILLKRMDPKILIKTRMCPFLLNFYIKLELF